MGESVTFGSWHFNPQARLLSRRDSSGALTPVPLSSRALDILALLLQRPGTVVSKDALMAAVWPDTNVEPNNLTVHISALRRTLDEHRAGGSCIQTVSGRGYRFVVPVARESHSPEPMPVSAGCNVVNESGNTEQSGSHATAMGTVTVGSRRSTWPWQGKRLIASAVGLALVMGVLLAATLRYGRTFLRADRTPLSLVVLPFENLSGNADDGYLADGITDDLTSDLSHIPGTFVIARQSAYSYRAKGEGTRQIAAELGVRYVIEGSVHKMGPTLRVNVQLTSGDTGAQLWSDRFDEQITSLAVGQEQIVARMRSELGISLLEIAKTRSLREHPTNPDAFDLILRARALYNQPTNVQRHIQAQALFERALVLDPSSVTALSWVVLCLLESADRAGWGNLEEIQRVEQLVAKASEIAPDNGEELGATFQWLRAMGRCREAIPVAEKLIQLFPNYALGYAYLGSCKILTGHADEDPPLEMKAIELNPRDPNMFLRYWRMGTAAVLLGRDEDAIPLLERAIALEGDYGGNKAAIHRQLAAALAMTGKMDEAKRSLAEADRTWPYDTVRSHVPDDQTSAALANQVRHLQDGLRLAGERDHADEDADFAIPSDGLLHRRIAGHTPTDAPGVRTIHTADLARLLEVHPVIIDTATNSWGRSIPGAIGLKYAGIAGDFQDAAQDHLRRKTRVLTASDLDQPIVALGWNSECFDGRNLALRLVALGYTQVYWYRGGREAWEVAGLPEAPLELQEW